MALGAIKDREFNKFREDADGGTSVSVTSQNTATKVETVGAVVYVGEAVIGSLGSEAVWQILRVTTSGASTIIEWADSNDNFDNIWDNRGSLTYG